MKKAITSVVLAAILFLPFSALAKVPNDTSYSYQSPFWNSINAPLAWDYTTGSNEVVVAIIDSGADVMNPDLQANIWQNPREVASNGVDDDNNGYVDDINGWNFVENNADIRNAVLNSNTDEEAVNHGSLVAGLIGEVGNNGRSGTGMNWQVKLMPLRAINNLGSGSYTDIDQAVNYAVRNGARVISMSFVGEENDPVLRASLYSAYQKGIVIVAAAGNNRQVGTGNTTNYPYYPLCYDSNDSENWILGVTSVDLNNRLSSFGNYGRCVDIAAPGEYIYSTEHYLPEQGYAQEFGGAWQGTSFATPIVAGTAALLKALRPTWKAEQIISNILQNAENVDSLNPSFTGQLGYGKLNAGASVQKAAEELITKKPAILVERSGTLNYLKDNSLFAYDTATAASTFLARVQDGKLTSWTDTASDGWALLVYRAPYYFIQLRDSAGDFINEFAVGDVEALKKKQVNITKIGQGIVDGEERLVVTENKKTSTDVVVYNLQGEEVNRFAINSKLNNWSVYNNYLATAHFKNTTTLVLRLYNLDGTFLKEKTILKVYGLDDLDLGSLWGGEDPQIIVLVRKSRERSKLERTIVDIMSGSTLVRAVKNPGIKTHWYLFLTDFDGDGREDYLTYRLTGGNYEFLTGKGQALATWALPKF